MYDLVSVIIPTFGRESKFLERAINSVLTQSYPYIELIIVNDNIPDTYEYRQIKEFCTYIPDICYIESGHQGPCSARNLGADNSTGRYLAFLDDDDVWISNKIETQIKLFTPEVGLVYSNGYWVYTNVTPTLKEEYRKDFKTKVTFSDLLIKNHIGTTSQIMVSRECFYSCGKFDNSFPARQDYDFCLKVSQQYQLVGTPDYLFEHYVHNEPQIIRSSQKSLIGYRRLLQKYFDDYKKNPAALSSISYRIARIAFTEHRYLLWIKYLTISLICNPTDAKNIFKKTIDGKTL